MIWGALARTVGRTAGRAALAAAVREGPRIARSVQQARSGARRPDVRRVVYAPRLDGRADPGEVVWTWVAYEDDPSLGKDRPVLVVGRVGSALLGLMLSSSARHEGEPGWLGLGTGPWDDADRPSWVRLDRLLELREDSVRREGAVLDRRRFDLVAQALRADHGWT